MLCKCSGNVLIGFRRYFPIPFGIRESFREIAVRHKRVKGLGRNSSYLAGFSIFFFFFSWFYEKVQSVAKKMTQNLSL